MIILPFADSTGTGNASGSLILTLDRFIQEDPPEPIAVILIIIKTPDEDTLLLPSITLKIFFTLPVVLFIIPLLIKVVAPF